MKPVKDRGERETRECEYFRVAGSCKLSVTQFKGRSLMLFLLSVRISIVLYRSIDPKKCIRACIDLISLCKLQHVVIAFCFAIKLVCVTERKEGEMSACARLLSIPKPQTLAFELVRCITGFSE